MIIVTGGCGFIGSNFVLDWLSIENESILVLDNLTYAGNFANLNSVKNHPLFNFVKGDINDQPLLVSLLKKYKPRAILNFAAESHVDRSINNPENFIKTNINGTFCLLDTAYHYWLTLNEQEKSLFRFLHVSTDEVYGALKPNDPPFSELTAYNPKNPYSASKAAADHLVSAYYHTYGFPTLITNCSNNYGPYQFPEKLIPFVITNALENKPLLIYGDGLQIRDWLYVTDHCSAIRKVLAEGVIGESYNIGGYCEKSNLEVVKTLCSILDELKPSVQLSSYTSLITHIEDRPGHDRRYAINANKIEQTLGWRAQENFHSGIQKTVAWYLENISWINHVKQNTHHQQWLDVNYRNRKVL